MTTEDAPPGGGSGSQGPSRRSVLHRGGAAGIGALGLSALPGTAVPAVAAPANAHAAPGGRAADDGAGAPQRIDVRESANLCAALSPDGRQLALDALNVIWLLPAAGGTARRLTDDVQDATRPHWSPDGRSVVFQSYRSGAYDLWSVRPDGSALRQLTGGPGHDQEPAFSPDGRRIAFTSDRGNAGRIWLLDTATDTTRPLTEGDRQCGTPAWSPDGRRVLYAADGSIEAADIHTGTPERLVEAPEGAVLSAPSLSPDGKRLGYVRTTGPRAELVVDGAVVSGDEDVFAFAPVWLSGSGLLYTADGRIRRRTLPDGEPEDVPFTASVTVARTPYRRRTRDLTSRRPRTVLGVADPVLSPDGRQIAFRALNSLWLLRIGGRPRKIASDGYFNSAPDWSPDGRSLVYVSDRAGTPNLWTYDVSEGTTRRLTDLPDAQLAPRWSPDGSRIAYQDESGATWVLKVADSSVTKVLTELYQPGRPAWSPDGKTLALAAVKPYSARGTTGHNQILTVDLEDGGIRYQAVSSERSLSTRSGDGPVWTRTGAYVVGMESLAWRVPVDRTGRITGAPRKLTDEVTDSLSVSADGGTLLYLSNGRLRTVSTDGRGRPRTVETHLTYRRPAPPRQTVVRAGAVWDGSGAEMRHDADVVVRDGRITQVVPRGSVRGAQVIDASGLSVLPGLIDTHNHWHWRGPQWGDRQGRAWLAYGVTTSRSPSDPAYQMAETREALEAGAKVGPRFLGSGEGMDGMRSNHQVMRPVFSREQLERDLERAFALEYDVVKSYMRLPVAYERHVVERAHARGIPVTSHYLYPAADTGLDGMEHTGGGNRLGYSRTLSAAAGRTFSDSVELLAASGMWMSTTTLFASELFLDDRSLIEDERTKVLFPPWEYDRLVQKADDAAGPDKELNHAWTVGDVDMLLRVHRAGGLVVAGTDAALDDIGISIHQNLRAMVKYGFSPREALTTATGNAARALGRRGELGAVAPGHLADLVCVEGDPLRDITAAAAVRRVMVGGIDHSVPELLAPFRAPGTRKAMERQEPGAGARTAVNRVRSAAPGAEPDGKHYWHRSEWRHQGCCRPR
ncbi:WD40 repeat protein [Streptomyces sp. Amel2xB2]|uniref:amidohydrolase family protein n=1 Tax=Streptomyces sp. Amel2xB2 TaxID=1305829 RepID=UPI000DBAA0B5|nr:amidohydrolase family protein [Streptomyces sp. Amel2xB2]RAJ60495.1 WD40 repeat protein [Streptomyces sp. Amel2xB2]